MKKIKIRTETLRISQIESNVKNATYEINARLREAFDAIGIIPSDEMLRDCFLGTEDLVTKEFYKKLNSELSVITMPLTRLVFEQSAQEGLKKFNITRAEIIGRYGSETFKYISFEAGTALFSDESKQRLSDECTVFISEPEEIELYNQHLEACAALNKMYKGYRSDFWYQHFEFENGKFIPNPLVQYNVLLNNIKINQ